MDSASTTQNANFPYYISTNIDELFSTPSKTKFVKYKQLDSTAEYVEHPGAEVVESFPLSFVTPPLPVVEEFEFNMDELTTVQLDAVRLISARFEETFIETGVRKGFLLGDGPGLGKTRILAAVIRNEFSKGHEKHLFMSISHNLFTDVLNEFIAITSKEWVDDHVKSIDQFQTVLELVQFKGVVFMTYHRLRKSRKRSDPVPQKASQLTGLEVIEYFCGSEIGFDGVMALDESHVGKNALNPVLDLRSRVGRKLLFVVNKYKNAKVVYSTATPASNPNHFGIMSRLGVWGNGKFLSDFKTFDKHMSRWELAVAEVLALQLKQEGAMVCRQISFEGVKARAQYVPTDREPLNFKEDYDKFSKMWSDMYRDIDKIASYCDSDARKTKKATFFAAMMNFFRAMIIHSKLDHLVEMIKDAIQEGNVVVVGIQGTGESSYSEYNKQEGYDALISNAKEILEKLVRNHFCVAVSSRANKNSNKRSHEEMLETNRTDDDDETNDALNLSESDDDEGEDGSGLPNPSTVNNSNNIPAGESLVRPKLITYDGHSFECVDLVEVNKMRQDWLDIIQNIVNAPPNFLDELLLRLSSVEGIKVAEITGRKLQVKPIWDKDGAGEEVMYELKDRSVDIDMERKKFMEGEANVAIISDAGSTGISLHASNARAEYCKKKRVHITVELGWSAEKLLQQIGRTHRANQKQTPEYEFLFSNVPSEIRFTSIILGRLATMSAFSCAQRDIELCGRLSDQAMYDSNPGIRGIRAALSYFFDEEVPIPYARDVCQKDEVVTQLKNFGLLNKKEKKIFAKSQGRTLKRANLTKIMNKLLGCTIDVQNAFCDVWLFYLTYFQQQYNKDNGIVVVSPKVCNVVVEEEEELVKHIREEGLVVTETRESAETGERMDTESDHEEELEAMNDDLMEDGNDVEPTSSIQNEDIPPTAYENDNLQPVLHGRVNLTTLKVFLGCSLKTVVDLYHAIPESDKISAFYTDANIPCLKNTRRFYLENKCLGEDDQMQLLQKKLPEISLDRTVCVLYQCHQPPMELNVAQVLQFIAIMIRELDGMAIQGWIKQQQFLTYHCIHKFCHGDCSSPNCSVGKRYEQKYIVEGDLPAIWDDITCILQDEDPPVVLCQKFNDDVKIGIEIPKFKTESLKLIVKGHEFYESVNLER